MLAAMLATLRAHKARVVLTLVAVVLGVSFVAGTFVLADTVDHAVGTAFTAAAAGQVTVRAHPNYGATVVGDVGPAPKPPPVPAALVARIAAEPGVRAAAGTVSGQVGLLDPARAPLPSTSYVLAADYQPDPALGTNRIVTGRAPAGPAEVAVDTGTLARRHWRLGERITVLSSHAPRVMVITGGLRVAAAGSLPGAVYLALAPATAQALLGRPGQWDAIVVAGRRGVGVAPLRASVGRGLPRGVEAVASTAIARENARAVRKALGLLTDFLLVFAAIAVVVCILVIANTFAILVAQRTRELALLRALGASRRQVMASVVVEAAVVGGVASALGIAGGVGLAAALEALVRAAGWGLPSGPIQLLGRTVAAGLGTGMLATLVASLGPARRAARVAPVAVLRDTGDGPEPRHHARTGVAALGAGAALLGFAALAHPAHRALALLGGGILVLGGAALVAPAAVGVLAQAIGAPFSALGGEPGRLARANASRNPRRSAATASALMVGVAVVAIVAILGASQQSAVAAAVDRSVRADYVLAGSARGFTPAAAAALARRPGVGTVAELRQGIWHDTDGGTHALAAVDPAVAPRALTIQARSGRLASLAAGAVLVDTQTASSRHLAVGDTIVMGFDRGGVRRLPVGGTFRPNHVLGAYVVSLATYDSVYATIADTAVFVTARGAAAQAGIHAVAAAYGDLRVDDQAAYTARQSSQAATALHLVDALLALSIVIAIVGIVNTLALSVLERVREIGLLRAVGAQRRQLRRTIRYETTIVSLIGAALGIGAGIAIGAALAAGFDFSGYHRVVVPAGTLALVAAGCGVAGLVASAWPARRAARLDVLEAVAHA